MTDSSQALCTAVEDLVSVRELNEILELQESMLGKFEKTNEMLRTVSELSMSRYKILSSDILKHAKNVALLKKELDSVFKRINAIKRSFTANFPEDMEYLSAHFNSGIPDDDDDNVKQRNIPQDSSVSSSLKMETICEQTNYE